MIPEVDNGLVVALDKDGRIAHEILQELRQFQVGLVEELLPSELAMPLIDLLQQEFAQLAEMTAPVSEMQRCDVLGHGEVWSSRLLAALLCHLDMDAAQLVISSSCRPQEEWRHTSLWGLPWPQLTHQESHWIVFCLREKKNKIGSGAC